ncbi:MAG: nucleotide exchange factor GrpE [Clostridia bacterium]|nr:nucleotide exchange factor GrpE [Clostridia bacterium]
MKDKKKKTTCGCGPDCTCGCQEGKECTCHDDECKCGCHEGKECHCHDHSKNCGCLDGDECTCSDDCQCDDECTCGCHCNEEDDISADALGYLELAQRIQADFENYKRRNADIEKNSFNNGIYACVTKLLPVLDSFKQARETITDESALAGLNIIHNQLIKALSSFGIYKIECVGQKFDPNFHNAVLTDCDETKEDEIILEELQEGFKSESRVIRHSVVKINKL